MNAETRNIELPLAFKSVIAPIILQKKISDVRSKIISLMMNRSVVINLPDKFKSDLEIIMSEGKKYLQFKGRTISVNAGLLKVYERLNNMLKVLKK